MTVERKLPIILFFVFLALTALGVLFYFTTLSMKEAIAVQRESRRVVSLVDETTALAFEVHSAFSTFMLTGNSTYLDPLERARPKLSDNAGQLRSLTARNPAQLDEVNRLDQSLKEYLSEVSRKIDVRKIEGPSVGQQELLWADGKTLLDQVRLSGDRIKSIEVSLQVGRDNAEDTRSNIAVWILIVSSVAGIVALGLANVTVFSEIRKRRGAEQKLRDANEGLERKIRERTVELKEANDRLVEIGRERELILDREKTARREAEIANRLRDEFMATVSHELRTPLNSILGWARLMKGKTLDESQSEKALSTIIKNSETQNRLIEDLLDVARVISGKLQLEIATLDLSAVVSEAVETVRPTAEAKRIKIELGVNSLGMSPNVNGDRNRLVQVFTNLLGNAVKFSPERSSVRMSITSIPGGWEVRIKDEGKGISPEFLPLVFERFRQDVSGAAGNGGLGLGLAIVRNLVEMHDGSVHAESEGLGKGATFTVVLPAAQSEGRGSRSGSDDLSHDGKQVIGDDVRTAV